MIGTDDLVSLLYNNLNQGKLLWSDIVLGYPSIRSQIWQAIGLSLATDTGLSLVTEAKYSRYCVNLSYRTTEAKYPKILVYT